MIAALTLISLIGNVAFLLWGMHMVQTGIVRAYGSDLRLVLNRALSSRLNATLAGLGVTALLQSSTATGMMATSFSTAGAMNVVSGLAVMLGANIGTTAIVQIFSFNVAAAAPALFLAGLMAFRRGKNTRWKDLGRVAIGLGIALLALHALIQVVEPLPHSALMSGLLAGLDGQIFVSFLLAALLSWAAHSSVAVVLLVISIAHTGAISVATSLAMVLGANAGSALNPYFEAADGGNVANRRIPLGNIITRAVGCLVAMPLLDLCASSLAWIDPDPARLTANFHTAFNIVVALAFLPLLDPLAQVLAKLLPDQPNPRDPSKPLYLDDGALSTPPVALANVTREVLRMADVVETMIRGMIDAFERDDRRHLAEIKSMDDVLDKLFASIKVYISRIDTEALSDAAGIRLGELLDFATNIEHIGDTIERSLTGLAAKKMRLKLKFSEQAKTEVRSAHERLLNNLRLAVAVVMEENVDLARRLVEEKGKFKANQRLARAVHFKELRQGSPTVLETSALHIDTLRDLRVINSLIVSSAYPLLDRYRSVVAEVE